MALGAGSHRSGTPGGPPPGARLTRKPPVSAAGRGRSRLRQPVSPLDYLGAETGSHVIPCEHGDCGCGRSGERVTRTPIAVGRARRADARRCSICLFWAAKVEK